MLNWHIKTLASDPKLGCAIGLMSGTSLDGLDACLIREVSPNGSIEVVATNHAPIPTFALQIFQNAAETGRVNLSDLLKAEIEYTDAIANQCLHLINQSSEAVSIIGFHGQTLWHEPDFSNTLQVGFAERLAVVTKTPVAHQFRRSDMARAGKGAPLAPLFHQKQFSRDTENVGVLNLGGIANITLLIQGNPIVGWDIGPGNTLSDQWYKQNYIGDFDHEGQLASSSAVNHDLLEQMLRDPYFWRPPPKSTGREYFNLNWLNEKLDMVSPTSPDIILATLNKLTATLVGRSIPENIDILAVCGGGVHNKHLMNLIDDATDCLVVSTEVFSIDPDYVEAACFGWLGLQTLKSNRLDLRSITGTSSITCLGCLISP